MREVQNSCRPLPNANNLSKNDVMVAHNEVKILLPPISGSASLQGSEETLIEVSHEDELQMHQSNSMLSVNAPEFTPQSKANSSQSSLINSPFESVSSEDSEDFKTSNEPYSRLVSSMTLPCIGCDNKLRQYLWKIDKVGDLLPLFNHSIPPPRIVAHRSFFGPSIIIPVCSSFKRASGGLIINQLQQMSAPAEG